MFPVGMEIAACIHTLVSICAKIVTLGLNQVCRQPGAAVTIGISQGSHQAVFDPIVHHFDIQYTYILNERLNPSRAFRVVS